VRTYNGVTLQITMIDTPGYTHSTNVEDWYKSIKKNITNRVNIYNIRFLMYKFIAYKEEKKKRQKDKALANKPLEDKRVK